MPRKAERDAQEMMLECTRRLLNVSKRELDDLRAKAKPSKR